jgi:hypothetical protein
LALSRYADARRGQVVIHVNAGEVDDLAGKATKQARRGAAGEGEFELVLASRSGCLEPNLER